MAKVNTVLGTISEHDLGVTLMHEHITYGYAGWYADDTMAPYDREGIVKDAIATLNQLKPYGVKTFVDVTTNDAGRDAGLIKEVAEKAEMNIMCSTGLYTEYEGRRRISDPECGSEGLLWRSPTCSKRKLAKA